MCLNGMKYFKIIIRLLELGAQEWVQESPVGPFCFLFSLFVTLISAPFYFFSGLFLGLGSGFQGCLLVLTYMQRI